VNERAKHADKLTSLRGERDPAQGEYFDFGHVVGLMSFSTSMKVSIRR